MNKNNAGDQYFCSLRLTAKYRRIILSEDPVKTDRPVEPEHDCIAVVVTIRDAHASLLAAEDRHPGGPVVAFIRNLDGASNLANIFLFDVPAMKTIHSEPGHRRSNPSRFGQEVSEDPSMHLNAIRIPPELPIQFSTPDHRDKTGLPI